jgi:hypothetical protein
MLRVDRRVLAATKVTAAGVMEEGEAVGSSSADGASFASGG